MLAVKRGEFKLEEIQKRADELFKRAEEAYVKSDLPSLPEYDKVNELLVEFFKDKINENTN